MEPPSAEGAPHSVDLHRGDLRLTVTGGSCVGHRYPANYDVLHISSERLLAVVADGMGAGQGSAVAGRTAVDTVVDALPVGGVADPGALRTVLDLAQRRVGEAGARLGELTGCTLTALVGADTDAGAWLVHIGDSRAYRLRDGILELLTADHTVAWLGAVYGWYPAGSAEAAAARYQMLRYVGHPGGPEPDVLSVTLRPADVYCLCTDGLAEQVPYRRLAELLAADLPAADVVRTLLADTLTAGGRDNATVVLVRVYAR